MRHLKKFEFFNINNQTKINEELVLTSLIGPIGVFSILMIFAATLKSGPHIGPKPPSFWEELKNGAEKLKNRLKFMFSKSLLTDEAESWIRDNFTKNTEIHNKMQDVINNILSDGLVSVKEQKPFNEAWNQMQILDRDFQKKLGELKIENPKLHFVITEEIKRLKIEFENKSS